LAGVVLSDGVLYGTASGGGHYGQGTLFRLNTNGTGFATLHSFAGTGDGGVPRAPLVVVGDTYYGTTSSSRVALYGTLFAFTPDVAPAPIPLSYQAAGGQLCLTWTNPSFCLQISRTANGVYTNIPTASSPWFVPIAAPQIFFRLQAN